LDPEKYQRYLEVLELSDGASVSEVRASYNRLRDLYASDSIALTTLDDELPDERIQEILEEIEEARDGLLRYLYGKREESAGEGSSAGKSAGTLPVTHFTGEALKKLREALGVELYEMEFSTKISKLHLQNIEDEKYDLLPPEVFLKGYLASYSRRLGLDVDKVVEDYFSRYRAWKRGKAG